MPNISEIAPELCVKYTCPYDLLSIIAKIDILFLPLRFLAVSQLPSLGGHFLYTAKIG